MALLLTAATFLAACGSDSSGIAVPTTPPAADATTTAPVTESSGSVPTGSGEIGSFADVQPAILQFQGAGSFREPGSDAEAVGWRGSGFFISPDGLAVTNNHVVSGAATLEVTAGGDTDVSWNARVIGASECNDLALVQVDVDEPVPYLDWSVEDISPGLEIYLAGFPLGDPEYTLVKGIISKANARGDTNWASIDETVQYDAQSQPGNSGGPVVDSGGDVVAVHYSASEQTNTSQFFGINSHLAQKVVQELMKGDFESVGLNGKAFVDEEAGLAGVWVSAVSAGGVASTTGLLPGDVILSLNGLPVGQDGTLRSYCDVLRTSGENAIKIEVLRFDTGEILTGELSGEKTLEVTQLLVAEDVPEDLPVSEAYSYEEVLDDSGQILMQVPTAWAQRQTQGQDLGDGIHPAIVAAPEIETFLSSSATGIFVAGYLGADWSSVLATYQGQLSCTEAGEVQTIDNGYLAGGGLVYAGCGGTGAVGLIALGTPDGSNAIVLLAQLNSEADFDALNQAVTTLLFLPTV